MPDTMTATKTVGALCAAMLVLMLGNWFAREIYHVGGYHGEGHSPGYVIEVADGGSNAGDKGQEVDFAALLASADMARGEKVFAKCRACHKTEDGANGTGPHLFGIVGRQIGIVDGFGYSSAMAATGEAWTIEALNAFLENPRGYAPGTKMAFIGLKKPADRANIIAWLDSLDD